MIAGAPANPAYIISNPTGWFTGSLDSVLESQVYFLGGYEEDLIGAFLGLFTDQSKRAIIDVGANIGTHSIAFARHSNWVVCFEPNENVFPKLQRNISNNQLSNVTACNYGLGDMSDNMSFYSIDNGNEGLGTFLDVEQYDRDLQKIGEFRIERGDDVLTGIIDGRLMQSSSTFRVLSRRRWLDCAKRLKRTARLHGLNLAMAPNHQSMNKTESCRYSHIRSTSSVLKLCAAS